MNPGSLVRPAYSIELCTGPDLERMVTRVDSSNPCLLLEEQDDPYPNRWEHDNISDSKIWRVLSPSGMTGWACSIHFEGA